jgi:hypothetical protein
MNSYTNNTKQLYIENIAVGLANVSNLYKLDMSLNEYLVVGQRNNINLTSNTLDTEYNFLINNNGVGINATRREMLNTNAGLYVNNNIICKGTITAKSVKFENLTLDSNLTSQKLNELITKVNSNLLFFEGYPYNDNKNVYTPSYLTIGNYASTYSNSHPLKVIDSPNGKAENIQLGIYNNINNDEEPARLAIGMLGFNQFTPANISTTEGMGLEFHISKSSKKIEELYSNGLGIPEHSNISNYPQMSIDLDGCININREKCHHQIIHNNQLKTPRLYVNGYAIISNIITYDYFHKSNLHLDDIYIRKNGLTLDANQIKGGHFIKDVFTFNSNLNIGSNLTNSYKLNVFGSGEFSQKITSESLKTCETIINGVAEFNKTTFFNNNVIFNDDLTINKSINVSNDLYIDGYRVNTSNISFATNGLNFDYGCNLAISGRLGTGILNTDNYDNQFNIIKRKQERFELSLEDKSALTTDNSKAYIGHTKLNNLYGNLDNSLVFLTQKNIKWHNIYFYAGKDKDGCEGFKCLVPNLAIMENNRIGINTNIPMRTLDLIGDFVANDYYIRKNNQEYSVNIIYINSQNSSILNVKNLDINLENKDYLNKKTLNIIGGINSYDGYFENNLKITNFKDYGKMSSVFNHIGIGISNTNNNYTIPLQIRNFSSNINNNSILRIYRGIRGGGFNNNAFYSGIDFCDYDMPIKTQNRNNYKWFIYKNHRNEENNTGTLQIGYTDNTYNPTHSCMNFFYNPTYKRYFIDINNPVVNHNYDFNTAVSIKGNVEIEGNLNLKGNSSYMINGVIIGNFSNQEVQSNILNNSNNITTNYTNDINDLSLIGNKIAIFPNKTSIIAYKDEWIFNKLNNIQTDNSFKTPLFIYNNNDYYDDVLPPVITKFYNKSFKNFDARPDIAIIELGILSDFNDTGDINNKIQFKLKGNHDLTIFEISPNNNYPFLTCLNFDNKNQLNIGKAEFYTSNHINYEDSCVNIYDDFDYLLKLTNNQKPVRIGFENEMNNWKFEVNNDFVFNYNNQDLLILNSNDINIPSIKVKSSKNNPSIECLNNYDITNDDDNSFVIDSYIKTPFSNLLITSNKYHFDYYDDNFDNNISSFSYDFNSNEYPIKDVNNNNIYNYHINNSNLIFNSNLIIDFTINLNNIELDYRYLESIPVYIDSNSIELIPSLRSYNPNLKAKITNFSIIPFDYDIDGVNLTLNYKIPQTLNNELLIASKITHSNFSSNFENNLYSNINLLTFLNVKDKPSNDYKIKTITNDFMVNIDNYNYNYNIVNSIYYYPVPNINITDVQLDFSYNYNLRNEINVPSNFFDNYMNACSIEGQDEKSIIINNSNTFLKNSINSDILNNYTDATSFKKNIKISSNVVKKVYPIEINNMDITTIELTFTKNDYYEIYDFENNNPDFFLPITINKFQPHLVFKNKINSQLSSQHKMFSYNDNYEIHLDDKKLISIDSNGSLNTNGNIDMKNVIFDGDIFYKNNGILTSITSNLTHIVGNNFHIQKDNISLNSSNIFLNPSIINNGGVIINGSDINSYNNLFQINNYNGNDDFITLKSVSNSGFINFWGIEDFYKIGVQNGNFGLWRGNSPYYNSFLQYTDERLYPSKLYDTSTDETTSSGEFLNVSPNIYYKQVISLNNNGISYGSGDYIIYSSSTSGTYYKINLFNKNLNSDIGAFWYNGNYKSPEGDFNSSHFIKSDYLGDWLIIKLPKPIILTSYRFFSRNGVDNRAPSLFRFYGSIDGINFTEIIEASNDINELTNSNYSSGFYEKKLNTSFNKLYTYIGFVVNKLVGGINGSYYPYWLNIAEFQIFGKEEINNSLIIIDKNNDININGNIKTINNFSINDITTYKSNDYKLRVFGNMKVDGVVMSSSDRRLKTNINKIEGAMDKIERLSGVFFNKIGDDKRQLGLIAQEVNEVIEEAVYKDENGYLNIAYGNLMGLIIEGMKELRNEIKNLK